MSDYRDLNEYNPSQLPSIVVQKNRESWLHTSYRQNAEGIKTSNYS